ncbi:MAG: CAP domain-containing protein [Pseudolysinimonas sp.]
MRPTAPLRRTVIISIASVALVAGTAAALSVPQSSLAAANTAASTTVTDAQRTQYVFNGTNEVRAQAGTTPLVRNAALDKVASDWAYQQWKNGAMSHNPNYSTQIPAGWTHAGENVASGYTYDTVVQAWVNSPEHYRNLVGDYTDLGVGYYQGADGTRYWSQVFGKYATTTVPPKQTPTTAPSAPSSSPSKPATPTSSSSTPASTPSSAPNTGGYPAEPAAPAGTSIPLSSPSFEASLSGWSASGASLDGPNTNARGGKYALAVTGGQTVSQTVSTTVTAGETDTVTIWVKPGSTAGITGSLKLTAIGGTTETATTSFSDSSGWMKVSVGLPVAKTGHTGLRIDVVLSNSGSAYRLDSASVVRTKNAPAPAAPSPTPTPSATSSTKPTTPVTPAPAPAPSTPAPKPTATPTPAPTPSPSSTPKSGGLLGLLGLGG